MTGLKTTLIRACTVAFALGFATAAFAADANLKDIKLPHMLSWSGYSVGSAAYNQAVAVASALKNHLGVNVRIVPNGNDVARQAPLRDHKMEFSATGLGAYYSQEGVFSFADPSWGPQPVRMLVMNNSRAHVGVVTAKDANIRTVADLKGKRVTWVIGAPSLNGQLEAVLAFANLTWKDVKKVEVSGFAASMNAILNNQADAGTLISTSGFATRIQASPRGIYWPPFPHSDKAGWARLQKHAPWLRPATSVIGAGVPKNFEGVSFPYPYIIAYPDQDQNLVYNLTKAIFAVYPYFKNATPGAGGFALDKQVFDYVFPYAKGAIRYFKEAGKWTAKAQAHNDRLLKRQAVLAAAWKEVKARKIDDKKAFRAAWMKARAAALEKAGFEPIWH